MLLMAVSVPLLPAAVVMVMSSRCRSKLSTLCRRALSWTLRLLRGNVCVRKTHAFVFSECTHGKVDSVLTTFDLYSETHPSLNIGPEIGEALDQVVKRLRPSRVLELGTHCGYSSVRMLRLLPPAGRLITVELDPVTADLGEEIILVAGFKHSQFQVLTSSSAEAIPTLRSYLEPDRRRSDGFDLVLMDHDPLQFLPDLLDLEEQQLLCSSGCSVVLITRRRRKDDLRKILDHIRLRPESWFIKTEMKFMVEIFYQKKSSDASKQAGLC